MKICHVNFARSYRGGERQTERLIRALAERDVAQRLLVRAGSPLATRLPDVRGLGIREVHWPYPLQPWHVRGCDLVHAHEAKAVHYADAAHLLGGPPWILTRRVPWRPGRRELTRGAYRRARCVIAISTAIENALHGYDPRLRVVRIPSMAGRVPADPEEVRKIRERFPGRRLLVNVAALSDRDKGQRVLLDAFRLLGREDVELCLVGDGPDRRALEAEAADIGNIHFSGFVENVSDWVAAAEIFVLPSRVEGLGSILLDAMALDRPIVASRTGGISEAVVDGESGLLVPPGDPRALAATIERLLNDAALRTRLVEGGRRQLNAFLPESIVERMLALYREVLGLTSSRSASST